MLRNVAGQSVYLYAHNASGPVINEQANITVAVRKDNAAIAAGAGAISQLSALLAPGIYVYEPTQAETDAAQVLFYGLCSTPDVLVDPLVEHGAEALNIDEFGNVGANAEELGAGAMADVEVATGAAIAGALPLDANMVEINGGTAALLKFLDSVGSMTPFTVIAGTQTASAFTTDLAEVTNNHHKDALCIFLTGPLAKQRKKVSASDGGVGKLLTVATPYTGAPGVGDVGILV